MIQQQYEIQIQNLQNEVQQLKNKLTAEMKKEHRYGLNWIDVPEAFDEETKNKIPTLEEVKENAISNNDGKPTHLLIEGDNYHALQCLNYTHEGKIDVIYIDPPYNTGKEFVYKDSRNLEKYPNGSLIDSEHPLRHSAWLSFMSKRLKLAKNLLSEKGVIFISIDDNEQANLKLLCDEVFGEKNFVGNYIWRKKYGGGQAVDYFVTEHEYILVYRKSDKLLWIDKKEQRDIKEFNKQDEKGNFKITKLAKWGNTARREDRPTMYFSIIAPDNSECFPIAPDGSDGRWRIGKPKMESLIADDLIYWEKKNNLWIPYEKEYFNNQEKILKDRSILYEVAETGNGSNVLTEIFGIKDIFENPKPTEVISKLISNIGTQFSIILDFFAGSGTTLHATMKLNEEDGGNRQCILVQLNENNICKEVTYERNKRVILGYTNSKGEQIAGLGNSLKYYKTAFVGKNDAQFATDEDKIELAKKAGSLISISENTLEEIKTTEYFQIFKNPVTQKHTAVYFNEDPINFDEFVEEINSVVELVETTNKVAVYVYCEGSPEIYENEFDDLTNIEIKPIPSPILQIYRTLNSI